MDLRRSTGPTSRPSAPTRQAGASTGTTTTSQRLAQLNGIAGVYEFEIDETGKTKDKIYEWK